MNIIKWIYNYSKEYATEMKKAWKGELKEKSSMELVEINWGVIKTILFGVCCVALGYFLWTRMAWLGIGLTLLFYFILGLILKHYEVL